MLKRQCKADLGTSYVVRGQPPLRCERKTHGDEWHERWSAPVRVRWREIEGGREVEFLGAPRS